MEKYINYQLRKYLDDLSAKIPAPGGGSASALVGATGACLLSMTANFTLGKKGYEKYTEEIEEILTVLKNAIERLYVLIDLDVEVYEKVSRVFKMAENTPEEKQIKEREKEKVLKEASDVPFEIIMICSSLMKVAEKLLTSGNRNLISDVGCGTLFLFSAIRSAKMNVNINLKSMKESDFKKNRILMCEKMFQESVNIAKNVVEQVEEFLK